MRTVHQWLSEYGESHQNAVNKFIHWICVPSIVLSVIGLLWSIPFPAALTVSPWLNWATVVMGLACVYYLVTSISLALGMIPIFAFLAWIVGQLDRLSTPLWQISIGIFVVAWIGQFIGHKIEGKKPSFFKDVQFLLIGPMWLLAFVYRRLGIPY